MTSPVAVGVPRDKTRVRLSLPELDSSVIQAALETGVRASVGDPAAEICWYYDGEDGAVITVKQETGAWWTRMPPAFEEMIGGYIGTSTLRWRDDTPPEPRDD